MSKRWPAVADRLRTMFRSSYRDRGDAARDRGDWLGAAEAYRAHLDEHPHDGAIWVQLGHASKEDSDFENALLAYSRAEELLGEDADLWLSYGHLFKRMGRLGPALAAYERSAELAPGMLGGEALIQAEQIRGRFAWRIDASSQPETSAPLPALMDVVRTAEGEGRTLFRSYFRSFEMR